MYYTKPINWNREVLAYMVGIALGDGNLSLMNGRSVRLRVSCDLKYPFLITEILGAIYYILPESRINIVKAAGQCVNIISHSNYWESILGWKANGGSKFLQNAKVPDWIWCKDEYIKACLKGLIESDGCVYNDRGYPMVAFTNTVRDLAVNVWYMIKWLGFAPRIYSVMPKSKFNTQRRYNVRLSKNVQEFLYLIQPVKA